MKILIVHNRYQQRGGEDSVADDEVALLRAGGHDVSTVFVSNDSIATFADKARAALGVADGPLARDQVAGRRPPLPAGCRPRPQLLPADLAARPRPRARARPGDGADAAQFPHHLRQRAADARRPAVRTLRRRHQPSCRRPSLLSRLVRRLGGARPHDRPAQARAHMAAPCRSLHRAFPFRPRCLRARRRSGRTDRRQAERRRRPGAGFRSPRAGVLYVGRLAKRRACRCSPPPRA